MRYRSKDLDKLDKHVQTMKYIHRFFRLNCAGQLFEEKIFPNAKEVTESFAAVNAVFEHITDDRQNPNINVFCVGDGHTPRTAALFAMLTAWNCYSIDPALKGKENKYNIKRLTVLPNKVEDLNSKIYSDKPSIIVGVHSHANISNMWNLSSNDKKAMVYIPCCYNELLPNIALTYEDNGIHSPKNKIYIWKQNI